MQEKNRISSLLRMAAEVNSGDARRINHLFKVYAYAKTIGELEGLSSFDQMVLEGAAALHDIGIRISLEKYGTSTGEYQQREGPAVARPMLEALSYPSQAIERILYLIAHHHTYTDIRGLDYQILVEADFLVNLDEGAAAPEERAAVRRNIFRTCGALALFDALFPAQ